jgi:hypothetical protein
VSLWITPAWVVVRATRVLRLCLALFAGAAAVAASVPNGISKAKTPRQIALLNEWRVTARPRYFDARCPLTKLFLTLDFKNSLLTFRIRPVNPA